MSRLWEPTPAGEARSMLGESPFWHAGEQALYYADIEGRKLRRYHPATGAEQSWSFESEPGCVAPIEGGGVLVARRDGIFRFDPASGESTFLLPSPCPDPSVERFNDGKCDEHGRLWCGTVYEPKQPPLAALYCLERGRLEKRANSISTSNGAAWSLDGRTMYWSDTPAHTIFALDYDPATGAVGERRVFKRFPLRDKGEPLDRYGGRPDGATVDSQGNYWVAMYEGGRVVQLSPVGDELQSIAIPAQCPTMPCFGGPDFKTLFVTTASAKRPAEELAAQPLAGRVFAIDVEVPGLEGHTYRP